MAQNNIYRSTDEGRTWKNDTITQKLLDKYDFRKLEFLDKNYALGYNRRDLNREEKKAEITQGIYYLLDFMNEVE